MPVQWLHFPLLHHLPEMVELERLLKSIHTSARVAVLGRVHVKEQSLPVYGISLGTESPQAPALGLFGGVHGLERIGTQVLIAYLQTVTELMRWDKAVHDLLEQARLIFIPLVNPGGMYLKSRSNPRGVDLMRNAPTEAEGKSPILLYRGHRLSPKLPWYRGPAFSPMEVEAQALCDFVRQEMFQSKVALALDVHSGYGAVDRLWFPYAKSQTPFPNLPEVFALKLMLDRTYPNHIYRVEPQSKQYTAHGDLWDYLYDEHRKQAEGKLFIPLSLELGSWMWMRKDMRRVFNVLGAFNPIIPHRLQRTLRRHVTLFDFLHRAVLSAGRWAVLPDSDRELLQRRAVGHWYGH